MTSDARAEEEKGDEAGDVDDVDENDEGKGKAHIVRRERLRADNSGFLH